MSQSSLPLKGTIDDAQAAEDPGAPTPVPLPSKPGQLSETTLDIVPVEPPPPPRKRRQAGADPYAPVGIGSSALRLYPSITVGTVYTSNVNASPSKAQSDVGLLLKPSLRLESNWVRHSLTAALSGDLVYYARTGDANANSLDSSASLHLDVRRHTTANLDAAYAITAAGSADPREDTLTGTAGVTQDFGPLATTFKAGATRKTFGDSGGQDNGDRDYVQPLLSLRTSFGLSDMLRPYVEASYNWRLHSQTPDRNGFDRDSIGYGLAAGLEIASGPIWAGDLGLTYLHRNYNDSALTAADALGLTGRMTWSPTELTRIVMSAGTSIDDATGAGQSGSPVWTAGVDVSHTLRDNLDLTAGASVELEDFGSTVDRTYDANLGLAWTLNPGLAWTAGYDLTWLDSGTAGASYVEHRVSTGLTLSH